MKTAGDEGSNLRLDVGVQHAHNAGDKRQSDVVPPRASVASLNGSRTRRMSAALSQSWYVIVVPAPHGRSFAYYNRLLLLLLLAAGDHSPLTAIDVDRCCCDHKSTSTCRLLTLVYVLPGTDLNSLI